MFKQSIEDKFKLPKRYQGAVQNIWNEYTQLYIEYQPINLAHGFPDYHMPNYITDALATATKSADHSLNQYARGYGHTRLVEALSDLYSKQIDRKIDALSEILVTSGAYEALYTIIQGFIDKGDEVIIIEPSFDSYEPVVKMCGGVVRHIPLRLKTSNSHVISSADYILDDVELEGLFNNRTKMIIVNTPNNPLGKVFNRDELTRIADLCKKFNVLAVMDEVYEWAIYDDNELVRMCSLPDMWERTISIGTAGKALGVTGWKVGWAYAPANLITNLQLVHQNCVDTCPTPIQEAVAVIFEIESKRIDTPECHFNVLKNELQEKRNFMIKSLREVGMKPVIPQGGYFLIADWSALENKVDLKSELDAQKDRRFTKWLIKNVGLLGIPPSAFFTESNKSLMENFIRFCFFKKDETLQKVSDILKNWIIEQ